MRNSILRRCEHEDILAMGIVLLEARPVGKNGESMWHYAVAGLTSYPARATYQSRPVWFVPARYASQTTREDAFFVREFR
jgi:hypothetical protein